MTALARTLSDIKWWWQRVHPPLNSNPDWRRANEAERSALRRGCTQAVHRAREAKKHSVLLDMVAGHPDPDIASRLFPNEKQAADRDRLRESW